MARILSKIHAQIDRRSQSQRLRPRGQSLPPRAARGTDRSWAYSAKTRRSGFIARRDRDGERDRSGEKCWRRWNKAPFAVITPDRCGGRRGSRLAEVIAHPGAKCGRESTEWFLGALPIRRMAERARGCGRAPRLVRMPAFVLIQAAGRTCRCRSCPAFLTAANGHTGVDCFNDNQDAAWRHKLFLDQIGDHLASINS